MAEFVVFGFGRTLAERFCWIRLKSPFLGTIISEVDSDSGGTYIHWTSVPFGLKADA